jgi:membrane AbrB-like protein
MSKPYQWVILVLLSATVFSLLHLAHLPAALLLASMVAGILTSLRSFSIRVPQILFLVAQGLIGCLMAQSLQHKMLQRLLHDWPLYVGIALLIMLTSLVLGQWLSRRNVLPGTTAIWGLAPGAASAMVLLSESYGADVRLVAFMQYTRVILVTGVTTLIAHLWMRTTAAAPLSTDWLELNSSLQVALTLALVTAGLLLSFAMCSPALAMIFPIVAGVLLQNFDLLHIELPPLLLSLAYALIGWTIGLRFTPATLSYAWKALAPVVLSISALIAFCTLLAAGLVWFGELNLLTAYLATSPGGADTVAIIAAGSTFVDIGFVITMQLTRFLMVFLLGPPLSRMVASRSRPA